MKNLIITLVLALTSTYGFSQLTCAAPYNIGTPTSTQNCTTLSNMGSGSSNCAGAGYGGGGGYVYINFCTNGANDCINFEFNDVTTSGNWSYAIYNAGSCTYTGNGGCMGNSGTGANFNTANMTLAANTCYVARVWVKGGPNTYQLCTNTEPTPNDDCPNATPIDATPTGDDNFCTTPGPTTNTPTITPAMICAGSLENTAWYTFTVLADGTVVITFDNIVCSGGAAGFQIGFFSGTCGSLTNDGCSSGSGGTVTATYTGLTAGDVLYIAVDGNAGANCTYDVSATNTVSLPIKLATFEAVYDKETGEVDLSWMTITETNNDYFTIERSTDGEIFEVVGIVDGAGNSTMVNNYGLADRNPYSGISYYRLAQTDFDLTTEYSKLIAVNIEGAYGGLSVYPNPVEGIGYLTFNSTADEIATITIYDVAGKRVHSQQYNAIKGDNKFELPTIELPQGMYFLTIGNNYETSNVKFIKE